jgi:hypothetical protein
MLLKQRDEASAQALQHMPKALQGLLFNKTFCCKPDLMKPFPCTNQHPLMNTQSRAEHLADELLQGRQLLGLNQVVRL